MNAPNSGRLTIRLTTGTLPAQIAEVRDRLDAWIQSMEPPSQKSGLVQSLRLVSMYPLVYELSLRDRCYSEPRTIL